MKKIIYLLFLMIFCGLSFFIYSTSKVNASIAAPAFVSEWGSYGDKEGEFNGARAITVDTDGNIYVADSGNLRIVKFSSDGVFITQWGRYRYTYEPGTFGGLCGLASDSHNNIYVADCSDARQHVQKFSSNGEFLGVLGGSRGPGEGQFFGGGQSDVAVDSEDNVYVLDTSARQIGYYGVHVFSGDGTFIRRWGPYGDAPLSEPYEDWELRNPVGIAIDSQDNVFISDGNRFIKKFTKDGEFITKWGLEDDNWTYIFRNPSGLAVDDKDNLYIADPASHNIQMFTGDGNFIAKWGSEGSGPGQFNMPYDVTAYGRYVYVADTLNNRIQKFAHPPYATSTPSNISTSLTMSVGGGESPIVKAKWEMNIDKEISTPFGYLGTDDSITSGAQFLPSGVKDVNKKIVLCSIVTDPDGLADINNVYADVFYPEGIGLGDSHISLPNQSGLGCGKPMQEDSLVKLSKVAGIVLFCDKIRNNNFGLPVFAPPYTYDEICKVDGELMKETAAVWCVEKDLSYEDPSGDYEVWAVPQDKVGLQGKFISHFTYLPLTAFETDFISINYGNVKLNTKKIIAGDLSLASSDKPSIRNTGNTRLNATVLQDDMNLGKTGTNWNVSYSARVGNNENDWRDYIPYQETVLEDILDLSEIEEMDYSILINKFPPTHIGSYSGNLTLGANLAAFRECQEGESVCGNNLLEMGEQCDDGNTQNGDGCSSICKTEIQND